MGQVRDGQEALGLRQVLPEHLEEAEKGAPVYLLYFMCVCFKLRASFCSCMFML